MGLALRVPPHAGRNLGAPDAAAGWVYLAPAFKADGVWDLWWIGVAPSAQGTGVGSKLLNFVESRVRDSGGRQVIFAKRITPQ